MSHRDAPSRGTRCHVTAALPPPHGAELGLAKTSEEKKEGGGTPRLP